MASADDGHLTSPAPTKIFLPGKKPPKADEAANTGCGDEFVFPHREKRKKRNKKDEEIALYKLKSAEALAGMKQVKTMISRFELAQFSEPEETLPHRRKSCKPSPERQCQSRTEALQPIIKGSGKTELENRYSHAKEQKGLTNVWESVLKPVRQRVIEIEKVLADTNPPPKLSHEDVARQLRNTSSKCSSTDDDNQELLALKALVEEGEKKICSLQESLKQANDRADKVKAENQRVSEDLKRMLLYQSAYTEEHKKNKRLEDEMKNNQSHITCMEQEFIKKLKAVQDKLHEEDLKNNRLLEDLRHNSIKAAQAKDLEEVRQKLRVCQEQLHQEQVKNAQLEEELDHLNASTNEQIKSMKNIHEQELQEAEERLASEKKLNKKMKSDLQKSQERSDVERKQMETNFTQRLQSLQDMLDKEKTRVAQLSEQMQQGQNECDEQRACMEEKLSQLNHSFQERLEDEKAAFIMAYSTEKEERQQQIDENTQEMNSIRTQLQNALSKEMEYHQQVYTLKNDLEQERGAHDELKHAHDELKHAHDEASGKVRELEEKLKHKTKLVTEEQYKRTLLQRELELSRDACSAQIKVVDAEHDIKLQDFKELLNNVHKQNDALREEKDAIVFQMCALEEEMKNERDRSEDKLNRYEKENTKLQGKLRRASAVIKTCKYSMKQLIRTKDDLHTKFTQQQHKTQELKEKNVAATAQIKKMETELKEQLRVCQELIAKEHLRNSTLQDQFSELEDKARLAHIAEHGYKQQVDKIYDELQHKEEENSSLHEQLCQAKECIKTSEELQEKYKQKVANLQQNLHTEQENILKLQDQVTKHQTEARQADLIQLDYEHRVISLQEELKQEQEKNTALQFDKHKAFDQMKTMETNIGEKVKLLGDEETKRTILQDEIAKLEQNTQKIHDQYQLQLETYQADLKLHQQQNRMLLEDKEKALEQIKLIEERLQEQTALFDLERQKNSTIEAELHELRESSEKGVATQHETEQKLDHLEQELREEREANAMLQTEKGQTLEQLKHTEEELDEKIRLLVEEEERNLTLQESMRQLEESAAKVEEIQAEYEDKLESVHEALQQEEDRCYELQKARDNAYEEMKCMDESLQERLEAFKEVFHEEQTRINALQQELEECKETTEARINVLKEENEKLMAENEKLMLENEKLMVENDKLMTERDTLETEVTEASSGSKHSLGTISKSSEHSLGTNSSSLESMVESSDGQEFSDEELCNNVNNNRIQGHLSRVVLTLQHKLERQDQCIREFGDSIGDYIVHQEQKNELCDAYIAELENVRDVSKQEISRLMKLVQIFTGTGAGSKASKSVQSDKILEKVEDGNQIKPQGDKAEPQGSLAGQQSSHIEPQEDLTEPHDNQVEPKEGKAEPKDSLAEPKRSHVEPLDDLNKPQDSQAEPHEGLPKPLEGQVEQQSSNVEPQEGLTEAQDNMADPHEGLPKLQEDQADQAEQQGDQNELQDHQDEQQSDEAEPQDDHDEPQNDTAKPQRGQVRLQDDQIEPRNNEHLCILLSSLHSKLEKTADQWQELEDHFLSGEQCDTQQAITSLFHIFQQLLEMIIVITDANEQLNSEISRFLSLSQRPQGDKQRQLKLQLRQAEQKNDAYCSEVAELNATIQRLEAAVLDKPTGPRQKLEQDIRGKLCQQKQALEAAARTQKQHKARLQHLQLMLDVKNEQLEEKCRSLDIATNALTDLKQDFERERSHKQRLSSQHRVELATRDNEVKRMSAQVQQLQDTIATMKKAEEKPNPITGKSHNNDKKNTHSEMNQLRQQVRKTESKMKDVAEDKDMQIKKLNVKLDKAHGLLMRVPKEHANSLQVCREKLILLCRELSAQKKSRCVDMEKVRELSDVSSDVLYQVQTMQRRMDRLKELTNSNTGKQ